MIKLNCDLKPTQLNGITKNTDSPKALWSLTSARTERSAIQPQVTAKFPSKFSSGFGLKSYN